MIKLSIIIINYKTPDLTSTCIESIYASQIEIPFEILVIDNNSDDDSHKIIMSRFPGVKWIQNNNNDGFGRANNLGAKNAEGKYILLLNSDIELVLEQRLEECLEKLEEDPKIGVLGCKLLNPDRSAQKSVYYDVGTFKYLLSYNHLWSKLFLPKPQSFDAVMGAFMLFRKNDFDKINGFDPDFFMYAEELELCVRLKKMNLRPFYFDQYAAVHNHAGGVPGLTWSIKQNLLSNALLYFKLRGWWGYFLYHLLFHLNIATNLFLWYFIPKRNRMNYRTLYKAYYYSYLKYFTIPFYYTFAINRKYLKVD